MMRTGGDGCSHRNSSYIPGLQVVQYITNPGAGWTCGLWLLVAQACGAREVLAGSDIIHYDYKFQNNSYKCLQGQIEVHIEKILARFLLDSNHFYVTYNPICEDISVGLMHGDCGCWEFGSDANVDELPRDFEFADPLVDVQHSRKPLIEYLNGGTTKAPSLQEYISVTRCFSLSAGVLSSYILQSTPASICIDIHLEF
jgi:hypothetical protein